MRAGGSIDACPLNTGLEGAPALNLELLNTTLAAIDGLYCRETGQAPGRVRLRDLADPGPEQGPPEGPGGQGTVDIP